MTSNFSVKKFVWTFERIFSDDKKNTSYIIFAEYKRNDQRFPEILKTPYAVYYFICHLRHSLIYNMGIKLLKIYQ